MYYVYILVSERDSKKSYVGYTSRKPIERLAEHNLGICFSTKSNCPWKLIYFESFCCQKCAETREVFLKSGFGYRYRKLILDNYQKLR